MGAQSTRRTAITRSDLGALESLQAPTKSAFILLSTDLEDRWRMGHADAVLEKALPLRNRLTESRARPAVALAPPLLLLLAACTPIISRTVVDRPIFDGKTSTLWIVEKDEMAQANDSLRVIVCHRDAAPACIRLVPPDMRNVDDYVRWLQSMPLAVRAHTHLPLARPPEPSRPTRPAQPTQSPDPAWYQPSDPPRAP
jgi:hypothetical protein